MIWAKVNWPSASVLTSASPHERTTPEIVSPVAASLTSPDSPAGVGVEVAVPVEVGVPVALGVTVAGIDVAVKVAEALGKGVAVSRG
jgi:hypothetical protein